MASNYAILVLIAEDTGSTTLVGLAIIAFSLPALIIGAPAGVFVDHRNKRRILWYSNCLRAIATFGFVIALLINRKEIIIIYLLTFLIASIGQFFTPAEGASIPMLVDEEELTPALSLFNITFIALAGPRLHHFRTNHPDFTAPGLLDRNIVPDHRHTLPCVRWVHRTIPPASFVDPKHPDNLPVGSQSLGAIQNLWNEVRVGWNFIRRKRKLYLAVIQLSNRRRTPAGHR